MNISSVMRNTQEAKNLPILTKGSGPVVLQMQLTNPEANICGIKQKELGWEKEERINKNTKAR